MSAGVLAVLRRMAGQALAFRESHGKSEDARDLQFTEDDDAIAAVAELIEADMALDSANHAITTTDPQSEDAETMEAMRAHRNRMIARRRKALAACGGAQ